MGRDVSGHAGHLQCPFCNGYEVDRLYLATLDMDSCVCGECGARWEERFEMAAAQPTCSTRMRSRSTFARPSP